jgi:hypothetical protein
MAHIYRNPNCMVESISGPTSLKYGCLAQKLRTFSNQSSSRRHIEGRYEGWRAVITLARHIYGPYFAYLYEPANSAAYIPLALDLRW